MLNKGYNYYVRNLVNNVNKNNDKYTAFVYGNYNYNVTVEIKDGKFVKGNCSCPYSEGCYNCKHIVALLYYLNNNEVNEVINKNTLDSIINNINEKDLKNYLINILLNDNDLLDRFRISFPDSFPSLTCKEYQQKIKNAIIESAGRDGFIDYNESWNYTKKMYQFISEANKIFRKGDSILSFQILKIILDNIIDLDIDDSNGSTGEIAGECINLIKDIMKKDEKKVIDNILEFLKNEIMYLNLYNYGIEFIELTDIFINNGYELPKIEEAILFGINYQLDSKYPYYLNNYLNLLLKIHNGEIKNVAKIITNCNIFNIKLYENIKCLFNDTEWKIEVVKIIDALQSSGKNKIILEIAIAECMTDLIYEMVKNYNIEQLNKYEKYLFPKYKKEICQIYIQELLKIVKNINNRKEYQEFANLVKKIKNIDKKEYNKFLELISPEMKRKKALREELSRIKLR